MRHLFMGICCIFLVIMSAYSQQDTVVESSIRDQQSVAVTIYNDDLGMIKDIRSISLATKSGELRFGDVASHIIPASVHVRSINASDEFKIFEQNYEYDLMNPDKLLDKYVGKEISVITFNENTNEKQETRARLLSNNEGQILKIGDKIFLGHPGYRALPRIPENLIARPTLMWQYGNTGPGTQRLQVSYLTKQIGWQADYVLVIDESDNFGDLSGWVTIDNRSGATYNNASLKLVAGNINRVKKRRPEMFDSARMMKYGAGAPQFEEQGFFEYHLYDLQRKTTIKNNQTKQIQLMNAGDIGLDKQYVVKGEQHYFFSPYRTNDPKRPVNVELRVKNSKKNNLGMPLPAGTVRMYKQDADGSQQFVGEDRIEHTPKNEEITLTAGEAFDIVAERKQTDFEQIGAGAYESAWEISLRNHKDSDITVTVEEPLSGDWKVVTRSHEFEKMDASTIRFAVRVAKNGEAKVRYRVRVKR
ncbi:MAG: DUF4139 domain-containing protein [Chitinispirillaceae bacterium]